MKVEHFEPEIMPVKKISLDYTHYFVKINKNRPVVNIKHQIKSGHRI